MLKNPSKAPIHLDIDRNPILEQLGFPFLNNPTDIRWARDSRKLYRVPDMPSVFCDGELLLCDRTEEEVRGWLHDKTGLEHLSKDTVQCFIDECSGETLPLPLPPLAVSDVNGAASFMHFDIGLDKPLSVNAEAYRWLTKEGYSLFYQPGKRKSAVVLKRSGDSVAGLLMPGDIDLTVRQIYLKAVRPKVADHLSDTIPDGNKYAAGVQVSDDLRKDTGEFSIMTPGFKTGKQAAAEAFQTIENQYEFGRHSKHTVYTGYRNIDLMLGAIACGSITVVAGDMISPFLANLVRKNAARLKKPVTTAVCCLRRAIPEYGIRLICMDSQLLVSDMRKGMIKESDWCRLATGAGRLSQERPLFFWDKLPTSIDGMADRARALKAEKPELRLVVLDSLEMITGDDKGAIGEGLRKLKLMADEQNIAVVTGSLSNMRFRQNKRNPFERYADALLLLRKKEKDYTAEVVTHEKNDPRYDYDEKLRGVVKVCTGSTILVKYPVEVEVRNNDGFLGSAIIQYIPQKGVFVNGE